MKTLFKSKKIMLLIVIGILFSCKNNQDGYSDEIETKTGTTVEDTAKAASDTTNKGINSTGSNSPTVTGGKNSNASSAGTGSGPGPDATDGATYTSSSGLTKDSVDSKHSKKKSK